MSGGSKSGETTGGEYIDPESSENTCAPGVKSHNGSCFSFNSLKRLAEAFNKYDKNNKISLNAGSRDELYDKVQKALFDKCNKDETCWVDQDFVQNENYFDLAKFTIKPKGPKGKYTWLTTSHIYEVLKQYENIYPDFEFIATVPIDFDQLFKEICHLDLQNFFTNNKKKFGLVFNLDPHYKSGSHWVALYCEFSDNKNEIHFFDSVGHGPHKEIQVLMDRFKRKAEKLGIKDIDVKINTISHQKKNSECGVYCIYFILNKLKNNELKDRVSDDEINRFRKKYFRNT